MHFLIQILPRKTIINNFYNLLFLIISFEKAWEYKLYFFLHKWGFFKILLCTVFSQSLNTADQLFPLKTMPTWIISFIPKNHEFNGIFMLMCKNGNFNKAKKDPSWSSCFFKLMCAKDCIYPYIHAWNFETRLNF